MADQIPAFERLLTLFCSLFTLSYFLAQLLLSFRVFFRVAFFRCFYLSASFKFLSVLSVLPVSFNHFALSRRTLILRGIMILSWSSLCRNGVWKTRPYTKSLIFSYRNHKDTTLWSITDHKRPHLFTYSDHRSSTTPSETFSPFCHTL